MEKIVLFLFLSFSCIAQNKDLEKALYACDSSYTIQGQHLQKAIVSDSLKSEVIILYKKENSILKKQIVKKKVVSFAKGVLTGVVITFITLILIQCQ